MCFFHSISNFFKLFGCKKEAHSVLTLIKERGVMTALGLGIFVPWAMKDPNKENWSGIKVFRAVAKFF